MRTFRTQAPGKVNLCLLLGEPRGDGLHELATAVQAVSLADRLTLGPTEGDRDEVVCPAVEGDNLAAQALAAYRGATGWSAPAVRLEIDKRVPIAGGMGGGSSDAAATLRLAARAARADPLEPDALDTGAVDADPLDPGALDALAFELGADVPALLEPGLAMVRGAGERVRRLPRPGMVGEMLVVPSPHRLPTADVFREADRLGLARPAAELEARAAEMEAALADGPLPGELLINDLEPAARSLCPQIGDALAAVRDAGARHAMVSGSGPTVVGVFDARPARLPATLASAVWARPVGPESAAVEVLAPGEVAR